MINHNDHLDRAAMLYAEMETQIRQARNMALIHKDKPKREIEAILSNDGTPAAAIKIVMNEISKSNDQTQGGDNT